MLQPHGAFGMIWNIEDCKCQTLSLSALHILLSHAHDVSSEDPFKTLGKECMHTANFPKFNMHTLNHQPHSAIFLSKPQL